jgi:hypothetical protein
MLQVKLSTGSDGLPVGWPVECKETPNATLEPGYDVVWTPAQLEAAKTTLRPQYNAALAVIELPAKRQAAKAAVDAELTRRFYGGGVAIGADWAALNTENWIYYLTLRSQGASLPANTYVEKYDGTGRLVTSAEMTALINAVQARYVAFKTAASVAMQAFDASPSTWTLESVVWPASAPGFV